MFATQNSVCVSKSEFTTLLKSAMSCPIGWYIGLDETGNICEGEEFIYDSLVAHDTLGDGWEDVSDADIVDQFFGGHLDIRTRVAGFGEGMEIVYVD